MRGNKEEPKAAQQQVCIAMDIDDDSDGRSSDASSDVRITHPNPPRRKVNATVKFSNDTMSTTMEKVNIQFPDHSQHIMGLEGQVKENMSMTKRICERLDNHIAEIARQHGDLADNILNSLRFGNDSTQGDEPMVPTTSV